LADGTVLLLRHLESLLSTPNSTPNPLALPKAKLIYSSSEPVTGLGFRPPSAVTSSTEKRSTLLFLVTTSRVLSYVASGKGGAIPDVLDDIGAALNCSVVMPSGDVVIARDEAVYVYGPEGRGACYALDGTKSSVHAYGNSIVIVSPPFIPSAASNSATVRDYVARNANAGRDYMGSDISKVSIFDLELKFIAHSGTYTEGVRDVFCEWGDVFVLTNDGKVSWMLSEI
jgi:vacuolar protein sorting-associated protein 11